MTLTLKAVVLRISKYTLGYLEKLISQISRKTTHRSFNGDGIFKAVKFEFLLSTPYIAFNGIFLNKTWIYDHLNADLKKVVLVDSCCELRISLIKIYVVVHPNDYDYDDEKGTLNPIKLSLKAFNG